MTTGWDESAAAWIASLDERGDFGRRYVLDPIMEGRVHRGGFKDALDVGCGEGRFCRFMRGLGIRTVGVDPTEALIDEARRRDPEGEYRIGRAEALELPSESFDLVVCYLSLIDITELERAVEEIVRVLRPGGTLLIANLTSFTSAAADVGWVHDESGTALHYPVDRYLEERGIWVSWRGIRVLNWHRPLSRYMSLLLMHGLELRYFYEPAPVGGDPATAERCRRVPFFVVMEWSKG